MTHVELHCLLADPAGDVGVVEDLGGRAEQPRPDAVGEPAVLVAQLLLAVGQSRATQEIVHSSRPPSLST